MTTTLRRFAALLILMQAQDVSAQEAPRPAAPFRSLEVLNAHHDRQLADLERRRLADLDALAFTKSGADGDAVYRALFLRALAHDLLAEATPAAERYLAGSGPAEELRALATLVAPMNDAEHGRFDRMPRLTAPAGR
jgi:hypothetical protein